MEVFTKLTGTEKKKESEIKRIIRRLSTVSKSQGSMNFKDTDEQIKTSDTLVSATNVNPSPSDALNVSPSLVGVSNGFRKI